MTVEYIKIEASREPLATETVVKQLHSLRRLDDDDSGLLRGSDPPVFEFLAVSQGGNAPVSFYVGCDDETTLDALERKLRSAYPDSFGIGRDLLSLEEALLAETDTLETDGGEAAELELRDGGEAPTNEG